MSIVGNLFAGTSAPSKLDILRTNSCMDSVISPSLNSSPWDLELPETLCFCFLFFFVASYSSISFCLSRSSAFNSSSPPYNQESSLLGGRSMPLNSSAEYGIARISSIRRTGALSISLLQKTVVLQRVNLQSICRRNYQMTN